MMVVVSGARTAWVCTELVGLWVMLPVLLWRDVLPVVFRIGALVMAAVYALWIVRYERVRWDELGFRRSAQVLPSLRQGALWVAAAVPFLVLVTASIDGLHALWTWPTPATESVLALLTFYAVVSVTSQEFLFSSFFFWRYRPLFSPGFLVGLNVAVFAVAHMVYGSWVSVGLALLGRLVLATVYRRHGSFWGVWILHLLLAVTAFLVGLGRYFYRSTG
jgi:hypothetical protein